MNDMASIRNIRFLLLDMTFGPLGTAVETTGLVSGSVSTFFADIFRVDNLFSLAVGGDMER